jgi:ABC-type phosphate transport system substrate-binding protein
MKRKRAAWLFALAVGFGSWIAHWDRAAQAQDSDALVMVVNKSNTAAAGMTMGEARKLVLGETSGWRNGIKVVVVLTPAGSSDRAAVLKKVCGMSEAAFTRYQMQAAFTGQTAAAVHEAASVAAIKSAVKANPGAVGFLHKSQVDESVQSVLVLE